MENLKISLINFNHYYNLKEVMDELVIFDKNTGGVGMSYETFGKKVNDIIKNKVKNQSKLTFKEFVADISHIEETVDIDYQIYEQFIKASLTIKNIQNINKIKMDSWSWDDYGIAVSTIIQTYDK